MCPLGLLRSGKRRFDTSKGAVDRKLAQENGEKTPRVALQTFRRFRGAGDAQAPRFCCRVAGQAPEVTSLFSIPSVPILRPTPGCFSRRLDGKTLLLCNTSLHFSRGLIFTHNYCLRFLRVGRLASGSSESSASTSTARFFASASRSSCVWTPVTSTSPGSVVKVLGVEGSLQPY